MPITQRGGRRRALASLLTGALVAGLTVVGAAPAGAAADTAVSGGSATWNLKDSWTEYVGGSGTITPALTGGRSVYAPASGSVDPVSGIGEIRFGGSTRYSAHGGVLDVTVSDLRLTVSSPTTGVLTADFVTPATTSSDVEVAEVAVSTARTGDTLTVVADGNLSAALGDVDANLARYVGQAMSTLTATLDVPLPVVPATSTTTTLAVSPAGTSVEGTALALSATVAPAAAGTVEFRDGASPLGTASVSAGVARLEAPAPAVGTHSLSAHFTPTDAAAFMPSASASVAHTVAAEQVEPPALVADPQVTVTPSKDVDPTVENTFTISGTGFVGAGARKGAYVLLGDASIWQGDGPLVTEGWLGLRFLRTDQLSDGVFSTTITVPAGTFVAGRDYVVATSAAHELSVTDRTLDAFTPITLRAEEPTPVFEPKVEVFAADGTTPLGNTLVRAGDTVVVKGSGFDPAGNLAPEGNRPPISAGNPAGSYVVFGKFADAWKPSTGAPSSARVVGDQRWALSQAAFDAISPAFQGAVRGQWVTVSPEGEFTAELTVKPKQASGVDVAWPETGAFGVYTYGAGGVTNAAQELSVPINYTDAPAPAPLVVTPGAAAVQAGAKLTLTVDGLGSGDSVSSVRLGGANATFTAQGGKVTVTIPAGLALGAHPVEVTSALGATGGTSITVVGATPVGSLRWGVKESFRSYVGPSGITLGGGATSSANGVFSFVQTSSVEDHVSYAGSVRFTAHEGVLDTTLSAPQVVMAADGSARLLLDVRSATTSGGVVEGTVVLADLDLAAATVTSAGQAVTFAGVPAVLTAAGADAFSGFYPAGTVLDPVTFTVGADHEGDLPTPEPGGTPQPIDTTRATLSTYQVVPGGQVTISGVGFGANETGLTSIIRSTPRTLATGITANAGGAASATVTIPKDLEPGEHTLSLEGVNHQVSAVITVTGTVSTSGGSTAPQCYAQGVNGATLSWGVSDAFRAYIAGPIAKGSVSTSGVKDGASFTWSGGKGSFNTDLGKGRTSFAGSVRFTGHDGILDLRVSNPRVQVDGSTGTLVVDVVSSDMQGNTSTSKGVAFASLNLSGKKSTSGSTITWSGAPATLTAAGAKAFAGFYEPGTALAPVTFSFPIGGDVECDVYSGLADTGTDSATLTALAVLLLLGGAGLLVVSRRRRARADA